MGTFILDHEDVIFQMNVFLVFIFNASCNLKAEAVNLKLQTSNDYLLSVQSNRVNYNIEQLQQLL